MNEELQRARILVIDDDESERLLVRVALEGAGCQVVEANSATAALALCEREVFHMVLLDAVLTGMDGFEACRALRTFPGYRWVPIVMLTGLEGGEFMSRAYDAGATDFIVKTSDWAALVGRLRFSLRNGRALAELAHGAGESAPLLGLTSTARRSSRLLS